MQAQGLLKKASNLDIQVICALHGPILKENLGYYIDLYQKWTTYSVESEGIVIAYTSVYGNTKKAVEYLKEVLIKKGCKKVVLTDLARDDMAEAVEAAFRHEKLVLATTTYNGDIFPFMREFISELKERNYQNRTIALIENGSWAITAGNKMRQAFSNSKNIQFAETVVSIKSTMKEETKKTIEILADELMQE